MIQLEIVRKKIFFEAKVIRRWFQPATSTQWKTQEMQEKKQLNYTETLTSKEYEFIMLGEMPFSMDDKWFVYGEPETGWLHFYRSWSGREIYKVRFEACKEGYCIAEAWISASEEDAAFKADLLECKIPHKKKQTHQIWDV